jgi:hypothetical protein
MLCTDRYELNRPNAMLKHESQGDETLEVVGSERFMACGRVENLGQFRLVR